MEHEPEVFLDRTTVELSIWGAPDGQTYAYPQTRFIEAPSPFASMPDVKSSRWMNKGILPPGMPLEDVVKQGKLYSCRVAGIGVVTCYHVVCG